MSLKWFFDFAFRTHLLMMPTIVSVIGGGIYLSVFLLSEGGFSREALALPQLTGTLILFVTLAAYITAILPLQYQRVSSALKSLADLSEEHELHKVSQQLDKITRFGWAALAFGLVLGFAQNPLFIAQMSKTGDIFPLDIAFTAGSCLLWMLICLALVWRLRLSWAISQFALKLKLDLYKLHKIQPLVQIAIGDVLYVAGALAFTPLQSLDAEFRMGNYQSAIVIGLPAAILLFILPLWGLHLNIKSLRYLRLAQLQKALDETDRNAIVEIEITAAHLDRIREIKSWPVDFKLVTRFLIYVVIPPLAWVAAALVENYIDSF